MAIPLLLPSLWYVGYRCLFTGLRVARKAVVAQPERAALRLEDNAWLRFGKVLLALVAPIAGAGTDVIRHHPTALRFQQTRISSQARTHTLL